MKVKLPDLVTRAEVDHSTVDAENRRVRVTWTTGATVRRSGGAFGEPYDEELDMSPEAVRMDRMASGTSPVTRGHGSELDDVIGVIEEASLDGSTGSATLRFSKRADVTPIWQDIEDKILRNVSMGAVPYAAKVVGRSADGVKRIRLTDWEPRAIGVVPFGADPGAVIRSAETTHSCELEDSQDSPASVPGPALLRLQLEIEGELI